ncbi:UpxY family transcription antiterminator [uncultured Aquimarina sp.]|uniref:UpxY family transcription antiterminator n=1 Tax=uncultured Aquimarina sp. TaxID=575652 RepID=UPI0026034404|nr:UpxY family transcription antiterminator [uncultured Aquimarina sp.]
MGKLLKTGWYVLYVRSRYERKVDELLKENGLESFLPIVTTIRKWSDRQKKLEIPLFSSYVFVNIKTSMDFHKTLSVEGACSFIRFGSEYGIVKDEEINKIKFLVDADGVKDLKVDNESYEEGEVMLIQYGSLAGIECEVININNENKIIVRLDSINQGITATVPSNYLSKISKAV